MARERDRRDAEGFLAPGWLPGEARAGFGEADLGVRGVLTRGKCPAAAFPHPDAGPAQVFWGETSECVCQGLRNVSGFAGGVPRRAVFDNATEVGRRVGGEVRLSELFRRFAAHHGPGHALADPRSGSERGDAGNEVGCHRRNPFVPVPSSRDVAASDRRLLGDCPGPGGQAPPRARHARARAVRGGQGALSPLPPAAFSCARRETRRRGRQGVLAIGGPHRYSAGPAYALRRVDVAQGAEPPADLAADPGVLRDESAERGWEAAVEGLPRSLAASGGLDRAAVALSAVRAAAGDERVEYDEEAG